MRKVIRGYARDKHSNLILLLAMRKEFWSDKEQRSSRKKLLVSIEQTLDVFIRGVAVDA